MNGNFHSRGGRGSRLVSFSIHHDDQMSEVIFVQKCKENFQKYVIASLFPIKWTYGTEISIIFYFLFFDGLPCLPSGDTHLWCVSPFSPAPTSPVSAGQWECPETRRQYRHSQVSWQSKNILTLYIRLKLWYTIWSGSFLKVIGLMSSRSAADSILNYSEQIEGGIVTLVYLSNTAIDTTR